MNLRTYILRRLLVLPVLVVAASMIIFVLIRIAGSPAAIYVEPGMTSSEVQEIEERMQLDEPLPVQYVYWVGEVLRGNLGWSAVSVAPVEEVFFDKMLATIELSLAAGVVMIFVGIRLGTIAGIHRDRMPDHFARLFSISGASMPNFWLGVGFLVIFYVGLQWLPIGRSDPAIWDEIAHPTGLYTVDALLAGNWTAFVDAIRHLIMPAFVQGLTATAIIVRMMRSSLVEQLNEDYVDAARARGLPQKLIFLRYARRNALLPTVTVTGLALGLMFEGSVAVEIIFLWPGLGNWLSQAVVRGDQATTMVFVMFASILFLLVNLVVDIIYAHLDPRVRLGEAG